MSGSEERAFRLDAEEAELRDSAFDLVLKSELSALGVRTSVSIGSPCNRGARLREGAARGWGEWCEDGKKRRESSGLAARATLRKRKGG